MSITIQTDYPLALLYQTRVETREQQLHPRSTLKKLLELAECNPLEWLRSPPKSFHITELAYAVFVNSGLQEAESFQTQEI